MDLVSKWFSLTGEISYYKTSQVVLEQAWNQGIKPILVLNKIDRLILEKKLEPADAYTHINQVLEQVNSSWIYCRVPQGSATFFLIL